MKKLEISVIIPAYKEGNEVEYFMNELVNQLELLDRSYEILFIDNPTTGNSFEALSALTAKNKNIRYIQIMHPGIAVSDKSNKYMLGFELATGRYIFHMDADGQDRPEELPKFIEKLDKGYDLVVGRKLLRKDGFIYNLSSFIGNGAMRLLTGVKIKDMNNGFKGYRAEIAKSLSLIGGNFRFIPVILALQNRKITEVPAKHFERKYGNKKFSFLSRLQGGVFDLLATTIISKMGQTPIYFFGWTSITLFLFSAFFIFASYYLRNYEQLLSLTLFSLFALSALITALFGLLIEYSRVNTSGKSRKEMIVNSINL